MCTGRPVYTVLVSACVARRPCFPNIPRTVLAGLRSTASHSSKSTPSHTAPPHPAPYCTTASRHHAITPVPSVACSLPFAVGTHSNPCRSQSRAAPPPPILARSLRSGGSAHAYRKSGLVIGPSCVVRSMHVSAQCFHAPSRISPRAMIYVRWYVGTGTVDRLIVCDTVTTPMASC